jgi:hypothetical protein
MVGLLRQRRFYYTAWAQRLGIGVRRVKQPAHLRQQSGFTMPHRLVGGYQRKQPNHGAKWFGVSAGDWGQLSLNAKA